MPKTHIMGTGCPCSYTHMSLFTCSLKHTVLLLLLDFWELSFRRFLSTNLLFYEEDTETQRGDAHFPKLVEVCGCCSFYFN